MLSNEFLLPYPILLYHALPEMMKMASHYQVFDTFQDLYHKLEPVDPDMPKLALSSPISKFERIQMIIELLTLHDPWKIARDENLLLRNFGTRCSRQQSCEILVVAEFTLQYCTETYPKLVQQLWKWLVWLSDQVNVDMTSVFDSFSCHTTMINESNLDAASFFHLDVCRVASKTIQSIRFRKAKALFWKRIKKVRSFRGRHQRGKQMIIKKCHSIGLYSDLSFIVVAYAYVE
jgi:hypothetical protein